LCNFGFLGFGQKRANNCATRRTHLYYMDMVSLKDGYFRNQKTKKNIEKKQDRLVVIVRKKKRKKSDISTVKKRDEG
jgi:hypothetical protein